ncbi:hypothetical protein BV20DRAFT_969076 [Pilatotrama ljubarskyi]|nr:hypothetical protein BV20DRAFT_969076 [Pilatotrama ljubarskyi]
MCQSDSVQELPVTFCPELYLQRRGWVLDIMRREGITEVLDIGCGEGELLACLCNPAPWLAPPPPEVLPPTPSEKGTDDELAELHKDVLHPEKIAGLDISRSELADAAEVTKPPDPWQKSGLWHEPVRWEPLEVKIWEGSLAHVNQEFVGVECIVSTEVIEHLPDDVLQAFAPIVFGAYHPRIVVLTTPSYTFNARFTAPDAPPGARSGWPDTTKRTSRIFRHHDHKFEWTVEEFTQWCNEVAEKWGYDVELGGVGKAQEVDEWGRDEALGWASQVAAFKRREGVEWAEQRARQVAERGYRSPTGQPEQHKLLATHQHLAHEAGRRPQSLQAVGDLILERMVRLRETSLSTRELWFQNEVAIACGGWLDWLVRAIQAHDSLALHSSSGGLPGEWTIQLDPGLHHLIPPEASASPPDTDEIADPWDPFDEDLPWGEDASEVVILEHGDEVEERAWESQNIDWDKGMQDLETNADWGAPEGDWSSGSQWT